MKFKKGDKMYWKSSNTPAYEKLDDSDFGEWRSLEFNLNKPLEERFGFRWTDEQVHDYYKGIMNFVTEKDL